MAIRSVLLALAALSLPAEAAQPPAEARRPDPLSAPLQLAEVRDALGATLDSLPAVSLEYTTRVEFDRPAAEPPAPRSCVWRGSGDLFYFRRESTNEEGQAEVIAGGGAAAYGLMGPDGPFPIWKKSDFARTYYEAPTLTKPDVLLGLRVPISDASLWDALGSPSARVVGVEAVGGAPCQVVEARGVPMLPGRAVAGIVRAWLDPSRDMLPRRVRVVYDLDDPALAVRPGVADRLSRAEFVWTTEEFARVPNPAAAGGESWLPARAVERHRFGRTTLEVTAAEVRDEPTEDWFPVGW